MTPLAPLQLSQFPEGEIEVSLIIPARNAGNTLEDTVRDAWNFLKNCTAWNTFEIILVPNSEALEKNPDDPNGPTLQAARRLENEFPEHVRVFPHQLPRGKGASLRTGIQHS